MTDIMVAVIVDEEGLHRIWGELRDDTKGLLQIANVAGGALN